MILLAWRYYLNKHSKISSLNYLYDQASDGVLTCKGGLTSHAAIVMRNMGKSAVVGAKNISIDLDKGLMYCGRDGKMKIKRGDIITIDGSTGSIYSGAVPTVPAGEDEDFRTILRWADKYKRLKVFANAETIEDAKVVDTSFIQLIDFDKI